MAILTWWDDHTDKVSRRSNRWASTDRGWLFRDDSDTSLGHYLDYGPSAHDGSPRSAAGNVHACSVVTGASRYFVTYDAAKRWIESEAGIDTPCMSNPRSRIQETAAERFKRKAKIRARAHT